MIWNYRVIETLDLKTGVYAVYYEDGIPSFRAKDPVILNDDNQEMLNNEFNLIKKAFELRTMIETDGEYWSLTNKI